MAFFITAIDILLSYFYPINKSLKEVKKMNNFLFSLNATVPVFAVIVLGHFFKRIGLIDEHFASVANKCVFKACLPCLVFQDLADTNIRKNFDFKYVGFCFIATLTSILVVWFLSKKPYHED